MNTTNLDSLPCECLIHIINKSGDGDNILRNQVKLIEQLPLVAKAFSQIAVPFFQSNDTRRNQLYISKINAIVDNEKMIENISRLIKKGLVLDKAMIPKVEKMYGLSPQLKALLESGISPSQINNCPPPGYKRRKLNS